ncbi:phage tail-collar fiber domain-containing protein [Acinetobacter bereziniae]|uniref:phage tail-collar fiber domain-containing protein n=1 Tax=Acinetobacter bereziniae TaxID=106648 RepID=UPI0021CFF328|nr:phage tail protein [Acinetobacter bereziniae]MCU4417122.1 phage tail protein [Acinetobacter bereziniae]
MAEYYNVTTNLGDAEIANAIATNTKLNITHIAFGDGNGSVPTPTKTRTSLVREVHRQTVTKYERHPTNVNWIVIETIIPSDIGGFTIREMGIIANEKLISHGSHAPFEKIADPSGVSEYRLRFTQNVTDGSVVELTLDESLIYATQAWIDENYIKRSEIVDNLTTNEPAKPVSAKQAKVLQDTKLGKTENAASATKLQTARTIGGVSFDGSANINLPGVNTAGNQNTTGNAATATTAAACSGNAATATKLQTARTIGGVSFDGSANINLPGVNTAGNQSTTGNAATATSAAKWTTARTLTIGDSGKSVDGSDNVSWTRLDMGVPQTTTSTSVGVDNSESCIGYVTNTLLGSMDGALYSHVYSEIWKHQIQGDYRTGQIALRGKNNGTWQAWRTVLDSGNYNNYSPTKTGTGASGSWGISITGNAATATDCSRSVIAGNGLSGGGALTSNSTVTLGTPGNITATSTNSVTETSHTHNLDVNSLPFLGTGINKRKSIISGTTYTNTGNRPIFVTCSMSGSSSIAASATLDGRMIFSTNSSNQYSQSFVVGVGVSYSFTGNNLVCEEYS